MLLQRLDLHWLGPVLQVPIGLFLYLGTRRGQNSVVSGININKWVDEAQACMWAHCLSTADQAFFLFDNLEGEDWEEIRHCPELERIWLGSL